MAIKQTGPYRKGVLAFFPLLPFFFLLSCSARKEDPAPKDLIDKSKMKELIVDLSISEAVLNAQPLAEFNDTLKKLNVFKEHNVSLDQFVSSFKYYSEHPAQLVEIYKGVDSLVQIKELK